ncbi:unnamed protein product [Didymodactylos carnosus]|uniref:Nucleoporin NSP1-like C-terminal domain-containing protein n=1 Tax=Didymodactylos carnosus TaxID=1234261 RepID=A0A813U5T5_9BILA|nr:unnamed protein product [Didymodactylos carnosus]CAF0818761.1 unnamed protein product [Didymodactylos carnosus]CAF3567583.1 unnamed protein product [Didymodactylos carnosus]CAF3605053.1 unnamed protein product [Didymodactylos carnosus]
MSLPLDEILPIISKSNKTYSDLEQIIDIWHEYFTTKENALLRNAQELSNEQNLVNSKTEQFINSQNLLYDIEKSNNKFTLSINTLRKYNDELENEIDKLMNESKQFLPNLRQMNDVMIKTDVDRTNTYELMENVDKEIENVSDVLTNLNKTLNFNEQSSIANATSDIQTCFQDINEIENKIKSINLSSKQ